MPITYRNRFPVRQKRDDGSYGCRGCGGDIPPGRKTWCSKACYQRFDPDQVIREVKNRDKGVCQLCGKDNWAISKAWFASWREHGWAWRDKNPKPEKEEYDHIVPFSDGGPTVLDNMRTLCRECHKKVTAEWRKKKSKQP